MRVLDDQETLTTLARTTSADETPEISVFLPVYNEEPNLRPLHAKLDAALKALGRSAEIVYVDDGSNDGSLTILRELAAMDSSARGRVAKKLRTNGRDGRRHRRRPRQSSDPDGRGSPE